MPAASRRRRKTKTIQRREPRQQRAQATYGAALDATARIVRREGLAGLNTNRIAEVTGISIGTLYGYFPDKTAIVVALARRMLAQDRTALLAAVERAPAGRRIRALIRLLIAQHRHEPALRRAVMSVHLGEGHGGEHSVESFLARIAQKRDLGGIDPLRLFVATRAALGVARGLVEEESGAANFSDAEIEDEIVRLVGPYLNEPAARSPASRGAARTSS